MAEISNIISILTALLTGGFLMIFIETQKVSVSVTDRFHFIMQPFFRCFSSYVKFIACFKSCFIFKTTNSDNFNKLKKDIDNIARLGGRSIVIGCEYPADYFTAKDLDSICNTINEIWYLLNNNKEYFNEHISFDFHYAENKSQDTKMYLETIFPKYKGMNLKIDTLAKISGEFFTDIYQPIQHILPEYESWLKKEKQFKALILATIVFTMITMMLILVCSSYIPIWVYKVLCVICCGSLLFGLYKLIKIEDLSKTIMRK